MVDPDGRAPEVFPIIPLVIWGAIEVGLAIYDGYDVYTNRCCRVFQYGSLIFALNSYGPGSKSYGKRIIENQKALQNGTKVKF